MSNDLVKLDTSNNLEAMKVEKIVYLTFFSQNFIPFYSAHLYDSIAHSIVSNGAVFIELHMI